ncbi:hypothetical protein [Listeria monocytogenes]|uniref:hypothetical protein n=1 Tax=Listeria monocytogenes TaxID=1639 RepID=UPI00159F6ACF|nr:hypothetical protein [Listeria monocytogenes]EIM2068726.1 hypothetical protein [Listeria monocytogenes]EIM2090938.1 hypothetical protein [Listeria monocytogenes]EIM2258556.1 hypothetical protein [Listeria monocytogenes]
MMTVAELVEHLTQYKQNAIVKIHNDVTDELRDIYTDFEIEFNRSINFVLLCSREAEQ